MCHTAGALFNGRQPIQQRNGSGWRDHLCSFNLSVSTPAGTDYDMYGPYNAANTVSKFKSLMTDIRTFINTTYIPDVVTVAERIPGILEPGRRLWKTPFIWRVPDGIRSDS